MLDPFVGTGSLLVACTAFGAQCHGWDIDWRVLQGIIKGKRQPLFANGGAGTAVAEQCQWARAVRCCAVPCCAMPYHAV